MSKHLMETVGLDEAIILHSGCGVSSFPMRDYARVVHRFGPSVAEALRPQVEALFAEIDHLTPDWTREDMASAVDALRRDLSQRYPSLSAAAVDALVSTFSYSWK